MAMFHMWQNLINTSCLCVHEPFTVAKSGKDCFILTTVQHFTQTHINNALKLTLLSHGLDMHSHANTKSTSFLLTTDGWKMSNHWNSGDGGEKPKRLKKS